MLYKSTKMNSHTANRLESLSDKNIEIFPSVILNMEMDEPSTEYFQITPDKREHIKNKNKNLLSFILISPQKSWETLCHLKAHYLLNYSHSFYTNNGAILNY